MGEAMAEDSLLHTAELLKTALPYVDVRTKLTLDLLVKLYELIICFRNFRTNDIAACGFENKKVDAEALLNEIKPKCNQQERAFVDKILNIFQAKRMFEMYNSYMEVMKTMQGFEGFGKEDSDGDNTGNVMNNFSNFDFSSLFGDNFNAASFSDEDTNSFTLDENESNSETDDNKTPHNMHSNENKAYDSDGEIDDSFNSANDIEDVNSSDNDSNNSMFEALKAMIPPEQMGTFENLRMLFGSMSYDDNSKSDENKE